MSDRKSLNPYETALARYFHQPVPSPEFSARLARQLAAEPLPGAGHPRRIARAWVFASVIFLALFVSVLWFGPDRVLAVFRGLLGYVPEVGTVELEDTLVFPGPVSITRGGITLTVEDVTATADRTVVSVVLTGLPADQPVFWERSRVRLPGGEEWFAARVPKSTNSEYAKRTFSASFEFDSLPPGTDSLTFIWRQFGGKYQTDLIHQWEIPVQLRSASDPQLAPTYGAGYSLEEESATISSVSLQVLEIVTTSDRTLLHVRWTWPADRWDWQLVPATGGAYLQDASGKRYPALSEQTGLLDASGTEAAACADGGECYSQGGFLAFEPVAADAAGLRLHLPAFDLAWNPNLDFVVNLGSTPSTGDSFKLDAALPLPSGGELALDSARIESLSNLAGTPLGLRIQASNQPASANFQVETIWFRSQNKVLYPWAAAVWEDGQIPPGILLLEAAHAQGLLRGPWVVAVSAETQP